MSTFNKRVLIVDDDVDHRLILKAFFLEVWCLSIEIMEANSGEEAFPLVQKWYPHLILVDLSLKQMNGQGFIQHIRMLEKAQPIEMQQADPISPRVHIIAVSTNVSKAHRLAAFTAGCDDFICKPYAPNEMLQIVEKHIALINRYVQPNRYLCAA